MSHEQIAAEEKDALEQKLASRIWEPQFKRWKAWLKDPKRNEQAVAEMKAITDPHAVAFVVRYLAQGTDREQTTAAGILGGISSAASTHALARLAVFRADHRGPRGRR